MTTQEILQAAQAARMPLALADTDTKNAALEAMAVALIAASDAILAANQQDVENARGRVSDVMLDRLALTRSRLTDMAKACGRSRRCRTRWAMYCAKLCAPTALSLKRPLCRWGHRHHL